MDIGRNGRPIAPFRNMPSKSKSAVTERDACARNAADAHVAEPTQLATDRPATDRPTTEHSATGRSATDRCAHDHAAAHRSATEHPAPNRSAANATSDAINSPLLFSNNPQPMLIYDLEPLLFLDANAAALHQYQYTRDEMLGLHLTDIRPVDEIPRVLEAVRQSPTELTFRGQWRHQRKNGEVFDVEVTTQGLSFAGRDAILMAAQDVSARRAAEDKVAEHDAYIHALTENNPLAIVVLNAERRVLLCNPAFETLFGYQQSDIVGTEIDLLLAPARDADEALDLTKRAMNGEVARMEGKRRRSDGSMVDVQIVGVPLIANGKQIGCFGMYEDITERRRAEEAQHRAEERLRMLFEDAVGGIFQTTPQGRILSLNPALARMCGY